MRRASAVGLSVVAIVVVAVYVSAASGAASPIVAAWIQLGDASNPQVARVVVSSGDCPMLSLRSAKGETSIRMDIRAYPSAAFTDKVCSAEIPAGTTAAGVPGHRLPVAAKELRLIALVGDTGCATSKTQDCNDPKPNKKGWPFAKIASRIYAEHPDLIIHLGDILYRKSDSDCQEGCSAGVDADFFTPATPMLAAAPLVMVRGNHEGFGDNDCVGWFRYFAFGSSVKTCTKDQRYTSPYSINLTPRHKLIVLDTSFAPGKECNPKTHEESACAGPYGQQLQEANALATEPAWLISHVPLWDVAGGKGIEGGPGVLEQTLRVEHLSPKFLMVISGHLHQFEYLSFYPAGTTPVPAQLILGDGGTLMSSAIKIHPNTRVDDVTVHEGYAESAFGYGVIQLEKQDFPLIDPKSIIINTFQGNKTCSLRMYTLHCS